ncbi:hypothetical protein [Alteromonas sp. H39]|uniref:hypothetical protein n=1 Tax=Alteromonas sp. H39 TaxID=3389876 RepID=UPI0039DF547C
MAKARHTTFLSPVAAVSVSLLIVGVTGCASVYDQSIANIVVTDSYPLPSLVSESSGLYCLNNQALTINDSGNAATVFTIDSKARIVAQNTMEKPNVDWEAITASDDTVFVGDVGNNRGNRSSLSIEVINRDTMEFVRSLSIDYEGYKAGQNVPYAHDYDAEAMTRHDGKLLLFSKSWASRVSHVYEVNTDVAHQALKAVAHIEGLPGVITGADWDRIRQHYVIVGYASDPFGNFDTFLAEITPEFTVSKLWPLPDHNQVEGVCVANDGSYWVTQEAVGDSPATLLRIISPTPF